MTQLLSIIHNIELSIEAQMNAEHGFGCIWLLPNIGLLNLSAIQATNVQCIKMFLMTMFSYSVNVPGFRRRLSPEVRSIIRVHMRN